MSLALPENGGYSLTALGLRLKDPSLSIEAFTDICWMLGRFHEAVRFAIGDAVIQGEALYGEDAFGAFDALGLSPQAMQEYRRVAFSVPMSRRRKGLSWSHHRAVAALEPPAQKEWLKRAASESLSHHDLRDALRASEGPQDPPPLARCRCCGRDL